MKRKKGFLPLRALGKRVAIRFSDHSIYSHEPADCEILGFVEKINEKEVIIRWWSSFAEGQEVADTGDSNNEVARIVQGTIIKWALCEPRHWNEV